jgi:hypothetical protein
LTIPWKPPRAGKRICCISSHRLSRYYGTLAWRQGLRGEPATGALSRGEHVTDMTTAPGEVCRTIMVCVAPRSAAFPEAC